MPHIQRFSKYLCRNKSENLSVEFLDSSYGFQNVDNGVFDNVHLSSTNALYKMISKIPRIRVLVSNFLLNRKLNYLLKSKNFDLVNFHVVTPNTCRLIDIAHRYGVRTLVTPLGSDILRVPEKKIQNINLSFVNTDFVSSKTGTSFREVIHEKFNVSYNKIINLGYGSEVISSILKLRKTFVRKETADYFHINPSCFVICCGYNASKAQNHESILRALHNIKHFLPEKYQIIIPLSYGGNVYERKHTLEKLATDLDLDVTFITNYISSDEVAKLRLLTDMFIHIQTTDASNATIQEFLLANTNCINGAWLKYPMLESKGFPYYVVDEIECLPQVIQSALHNGKRPLSQEIENIIIDNSWECVSRQWVDFFTNL